MRHNILSDFQESTSQQSEFFDDKVIVFYTSSRCDAAACVTIYKTNPHTHTRLFDDDDPLLQLNVEK